MTVFCAMAPPISSNPPPPPREIVSVGRRQRALAFPLRLALQSWQRSLQIGLSPELSAAFRHPEPVLFLTWHNHIFILGELFRRFRSPAGLPLYAMISASRDGAWLAHLFEHYGMHAIRASSSWRGASGLRQARQRQAEGADLALTPDGPRGPRYHVQAGAWHLAKTSPGGVIVLGGVFSRARRLQTWDRFYLPLPQSKVRLEGRRIERSELISKGPTGLAKELLEVTVDNDEAAIP